MAYPSLIFSGEYREKLIDFDVMADLKINLLLPEDVLSLFCRPCHADDILLRQSSFIALSEIELRNHFVKLCKSISAVDELYKAYCIATSENERNVIFVSMINALYDFYMLSAENHGKGGAYDRYRDFFSSEIKREDLKAFFNKASELHGKYHEISKISFAVDKDMLKVSKNFSESFNEKIISAAMLLGLSCADDYEGGGMSEAMPAELIDEIASLNKAVFEELDKFYKDNEKLFDSTVLQYRHELSFYISVCRCLDKIKLANIPLCMPTISDKKELFAKDVYDITLLYKNCNEIIPNDLSFNGEEPFFFLTGANGGGKTTYLRAVGTAVLFFLMGCPIAARSANMCVLDAIYTHFPKDERFDVSGRFEDEELRVSEIISKASPYSFVLLNETYSTTSEETAVKYTMELADKLYNNNTFGIYVTHQQSMEGSNVPMLNVVVDTEDSNRRTYKISKKNDSKGSYAKDVLEKYGLTEEALEKRFGGDAL